MRKFQLKQTCGACPEAYDVFFDGETIGSLRLRHGGFRADYQGETVYSALVSGDGLFDPDERTKYLNLACMAIDEAMNEGDAIPAEPLFEMLDD